MTSLNIRIPNTLDQRLAMLAAHTGRTKSYYVREALEEKLEELEDCYLAIQSLENIKKGKSKVWSHKEIEKDCGLEH